MSDVLSSFEGTSLRVTVVLPEWRVSGFARRRFASHFGPDAAKLEKCIEKNYKCQTAISKTFRVRSKSKKGRTGGYLGTTGDEGRSKLR